MCTNGTNTRQLEQMIDQIDDHIALEYRWVHRLAHTADDVGFIKASERLHAVQALLADARAGLDEAKGALELSASGATAHIV
ncbi:MAG: dynein gamma chain protein [Bacteroidia bacterium]|nr:dynein gamma chain protein [Bacteroidia bacterium]NCC68870.1 dynein gamma chain protein [Clostridia bacterium]